MKAVQTFLLLFGIVSTIQAQNIDSVEIKPSTQDSIAQALGPTSTRKPIPLEHLDSLIESYDQGIETLSVEIEENPNAVLLIEYRKLYEVQRNDVIQLRDSLYPSQQRDTAIFRSIEKSEHN